MTFIRSSAAALAVTAFLSGAALAEPVIKVTLIDKVGTSDSDLPMLGMAMGGDMEKAKMAVTANPKTVRRGPVPSRSPISQAG